MHNRGQRTSTIPIQKTPAAAAEQAKVEENLEKVLLVLDAQEAFLWNHALQMGELYPLRRNEGLFSSPGAVRISESASKVQNGLLLARCDSFYTGAERRAAPKPASFCYWPREKLNCFQAFETPFSHVDCFDVSIAMNNKERNAQKKQPPK